MTRDDGLERLLEALPREAAPQIAVESILRKLLWRRVALAAALALMVGASVAGFVALREGSEPPVNLHIRVVEPAEMREPPAPGPREFNLP